MKYLVLAAVAALGLSAGISQPAQAFVRGTPHAHYHSGPYDNTGNGPGESGLEGGGG
jgi:hypothetical protein